MFYYAIKTTVSAERGEDYFTVVARGTKKQMLGWAERFDAKDKTLASKVVREEDGKVVHSYEK